AVERHFVEQDAGELAVMTEAVVEALRNGGDDSTQRINALANAITGHHGVFFEVRDAQGEAIYSMPGADLSQATVTLSPPSEINTANVQTWQEGDKSFRGMISQNEV